MQCCLTLRCLLIQAISICLIKKGIVVSTYTYISLDCYCPLFNCHCVIYMTGEVKWCIFLVYIIFPLFAKGDWPCNSLSKSLLNTPNRHFFVKMTPVLFCNLCGIIIINPVHYRWVPLPLNSFILIWPLPEMCAFLLFLSYILQHVTDSALIVLFASPQINLEFLKHIF